jgi:hypothetical protein
MHQALSLRNAATQFSCLPLPQCSLYIRTFQPPYLIHTELQSRNSLARAVLPTKSHIILHDAWACHDRDEASLPLNYILHALWHKATPLPPEPTSNAKDELATTSHRYEGQCVLQHQSQPQHTFHLRPIQTPQRSPQEHAKDGCRR